MKQIRLTKLILSDFQGGTFTLDANSEDLNVFGDNGIGKTRLISAFSWLLFDKDSLGRADFEIKNLDAQGQSAHGLEHSVEGILEGSDRDVIALKKIYKEIWTKKRGSAQATFSRHTTEYFVDGVPIQKKEFTQRVNEIAGDETIFRLLSAPTVFPALHWQKQRELLLEVCGDITDADVIAMDSKLSPLTEIFRKRKIDDHRKVLTAKKTEINKELDKIPVRIDEVRRGLPDAAGLDKDLLRSEIALFESTLNDLKLNLQGIDTGGRIAELSKQLAHINAEIQAAENLHNAEISKNLNKLNQEIAESELNLKMSKNLVAVLINEINQKQAQVARIETELQSLREKWVAIDIQQFQDTIENVCPTCKQDLPTEHVQQAREKAQEAFNLWKAEEIKTIEEKGAACVSEKTMYLSDIAQIQSQVDDLIASFHSAQTNIDLLKKRKETLIPSPFVIDPSFLDTKEGLNREIKEEREGKAQDINAIRVEIQRIEALLKDAKDKISLFALKDAGEKRIEELKADEKRLATEYEKLEAELYLIEQFIRTKVSLLTDRINSKFEIVRFKLFETLINGGVSECCEITVNGIPYFGGLNSGARINAGLDVIRTLQRHYGIYPIVFIDNAESVVELLPMECQVIRLIVSGQDKTLRVENQRR